MTIQHAQLEEANHAWQQFHQTQIESFRNKLQPSLPIEIDLSLDDIAEYIVRHIDEVNDEHKDLILQLTTSEKLINDLRSRKIFHFSYKTYFK